MRPLVRKGALWHSHTSSPLYANAVDFLKVYILRTEAAKETAG